MPRKQDPHAFDPFGRRFQSEAAEDPHACQHPGCSAPGEYRAPRDRRLTEYLWLCLDHVRDYNKAWNYYAGMREEDIEDEIRRDTCWQRPTWKLGSIGAGGRRWSEHMKDDFGFFADEEAEVRRGRNGWQRDGQRRRGAAESQEDRALRVLDLDAPYSKDDLKSRYKTLVKIHHPDVNHGDPAAEERLKDINEAYKTLLSALDP
jgi:hypothetical protein